MLVECWGLTPYYFQGLKSVALTTTYKTITSPSDIHCCRTCARDTFCASVIYRRSSRECQLSYVPLAAASAYKTPDATSIAYFLKDWTLVFRATPGIGIDVKDAWTTGNDVTSDDVTCTELATSSCSKHYRHPLVFNWKNMDINEVKVAFYKGDTEKYIVFDGKGSNITSWFQKEKILASSWSTITTKTYQYFSVEGEDQRQFFIINSYNGCVNDRIFMVVVAGQGRHFCTYDSHTTYPQFLFSTGDDYGAPQTMAGISKADVFAIFIK
ncbi:hypothetical protein DPMN_184871 [Dreissena polymorpha]|uniref:Apple domain-containing protein n=1 Tax=Dreissena polymorpha TaxID=45954 RepID=A0A9D4DL53_DREPO|nr:hypothetical protein DPMN_184871 [Dreissena polymorpha]